MVTDIKLLLQDSGDTEYYTDTQITDASREVMGSIDLDPASSILANKYVKAGKIFTKEDDGLAQDWFGNTFMNHPFSKGEKACPEDRSKCKKKSCRDRGYHIDEDIPSNADWINKLLFEYASGRVKQSCNICFAATSEGWFRPLHRFPQCYLIPRTNYYLPDGTKKEGVLKGSVVTYLGSHVDKFAKVFSKFGEVKIPYGFQS